MTHPHDAYRRPPAAIGVARPWEPAEALTLCWAGAVAGDVEAGRLTRARPAPLPYARPVTRHRREEAA